MSLFECIWLRKVSISAGKVDYIGYRFGKNVNTFFNKGGRAWVPITGFVCGRKDKFACLYLRYWGKGIEFGWGIWREICTPVQALVSLMALIFCIFSLKYLPNHLDMSNQKGDLSETLNECD